MNFFDTVQELLGTSRFVMSTYLSDMSDARACAGHVLLRASMRRPIQDAALGLL